MNESTDVSSKSSNASEVEASSATLPSDKPSDAPRPLEFESWMESGDRGDAPHGDGPGVPGRDRAQAFATLSREDALARFPELSTAYEAIDALRIQLSQAGHSQAGQDAALKHATQTMVQRLEAGQLPLARSSVQSRSPGHEPESPDRDR